MNRGVMGGISARKAFETVDPTAAAMDWPLPFRLKPKRPAGWRAQVALPADCVKSG